MQRKVNAALLGNELIFTASRSGGPGGQNVNKVNTKVTLKFNVNNSAVLTPEEKETISAKLGARMTNEGVLVLVSQDKRSQVRNKEAVVGKFEKIMAKAFERKKARKATRPGKTSIEDRIRKKKQQSEKKKWRQKPLG